MASHETYRRTFAIALIIIEIIVAIFFGIFVRTRTHDDATFNANYYPMYQDVNVMMLIGFGFLMTFLRFNSWSALSYTFFINAVIVQLYPLFGGFWEKSFTENGVQQLNSMSRH
jgi:ammonium transporter Rh